MDIEVTEAKVKVEAFRVADVTQGMCTEEEAKVHPGL